ncbi:MAG: hypothetical protein HY816_22585 [Candidatus Wallbacteria bacterium]|nr:hypothetical protein [Candidatus Wallbacteria bacterium]
MLHRGLVAIALLPALALGARADVPARVSARNEVFVVHVDSSNRESQLSAIAAASAAVRHTASGVERALLVTDDIENATVQRTLEAWKKMFQGKAVERVIFVGSVSEAAQQSFMAGLGTTHSQLLSGDPVAVSEGLAALSSQSGLRRTSDSMPEIPISTSVTDDEIVFAANAAAAASASGSVLRFSRNAPAVSTDEIRRRILSDTASTTVCIVENADQALPAAVAGAHYRGVTTTLPQSLLIAANGVHARVAGNKALHSIEKLQTLPPREPGLFEAERTAASAFFAWLAAQGLERADSLETVMIFAKSPPGGNGIPLSFDRYLMGSPQEPDKKGANVGRMPLSASENLCVINRSTLQTELAKVSPARGRAELSFVAFESNHAAGGSYGPWTDNFGKSHVVNELVGCPSKKDQGIHPALKAAGFKQFYCNGWDPATNPQKDPLEQSEQYGFLRRLNDGATLFYSSSHGDDDAFFPYEKDKSITADVAFGDPKWPSRRGRFTTMGADCTSADMDSKLQELNGTIAIFNACLVANGNMPTRLLRHGAGSVIASYISVSFDGAGWWGVVAVDSLAKGDSVAKAVGVAYRATSDIFPQGLQGVDDTLRYVIFGDPHVTMQMPVAQ